ncbi:MAG: type I 3-dehydroquinate dehydratase [Actinomycetota bacterium]
MNRLRRAIDLSSSGAAVVVPITDHESTADIAALTAAGADALELRIDRFADDSATSVIERARSAGDLAVLATVRISAEGGEWGGPEEDRGDLFRSILDHVDAIDVELAALGDDGPIREVVLEAKAAGVAVVVSAHDFAGTPGVDELTRLHADAIEAGADIVKLATTAHDRDALRRLATVLVATDHPSAFVAMGDLGPASRVFFPVLGSVLTYAHGGRHQLPGQLGVASTMELLDRFAPPPS